MSESDVPQSPTADNVVYLACTERGQARGIPYRVDTLRRHVASRLVRALRTGLERAQDALYQVAAQEEGEAATACAQGMRMVRLHRHDMEEILRAGVEYRFTALIDPETVEPPSIPAEDSAAGRMLAELRTQAGPTAAQATRALDAAMPAIRVSERLNPLHPEPVADLLLRTQHRAGLPEPARRVVTEILAEEVAAMLPTLHEEAVAHLAGGTLAPERTTSAESEQRYAERAARSREQVEQARHRVQREIERCLEGRRPPELVQRLIRNAWARLLLMIHLRHGADSEPWVRHCAVMERLVWSTDPQPDECSRRRLVLEIPLLLHEIADGLREVLPDPFEVSKLLTSLESEYLRCLTRDDPTLAQLSANDDTAEAEGREGDVRRIRALPVGTWMELEGAAGQRLRVRLASHDEQQRLIFANRAGFKVLERTPEDLAAAISEGRARLLDDHQIFNDGLSRVVRQLGERRLGHGD
ncbi:MAG: DUF1631 family protein [Halorhodospira sp.]